MTQHSRTREPAVIDRVDLAVEPGRGWYFYAHLASGASHQGFGGCFSGEDEARSFAEGVRRAFAVPTIGALKGEACFALRCWDQYSATIEGIESTRTGSRFTKSGWAAARGDDYSPLTVAQQSLTSEVAQLRRRLAETEQRLATISDGYVAWVPR